MDVTPLTANSEARQWNSGKRAERGARAVRAAHLWLCVSDLRTLADVDRDGRLQGDEFILAMHLVDMAKSGRPLPLTLPQDLVPPSLR